MQGRTTAAQPVLSQRVERKSVSTASYFSNVFAWCVGYIMRQEWTPVEVKQKAANPSNAFEAVKHEHRISTAPVVSRQEDDALAPTVKTSSGERYHGPRGRLLSFKKR